MRWAGRAVIIFGAALLAGCAPEQDGEPSATNNATERPTLSVAEPPLDREQLLLAAVRAASALAAGSDHSEAQRQLDGKRFELRIRFACGAENEERGSRFSTADRTLRLRMTPDLARDDPAVARIAGDGFESIEGFWLRRPWMLSAACPARSKPPAQPPETGDLDKTKEAAGASPAERRTPRLGIAQFFAASDSRVTRRRLRPYEATIVLDEGQVPSADGYDFILSGRLRALPDRGVIACSAERPDLPPDCIISVHVDRARMERPGTRELVAEWTP